MITVPDYGDNKVQEQGLPNSRVSGDVPLEALGGGQSAAALTQAQSQFGKEIQDQISKAKAEADKTMAMDVEAQMAPIEADLVHGPDGALSKKGINAQGEPERVVTDYRKAAQERIDKLGSADARNLATQRLQENQARIFSTVMSHATREQEAHQDSVNNAAIENWTNLAIKSKDPATLVKAHEVIIQNLDDYGNRKGMSNEEKYNIMVAAESKLNAGVVTSYLAADNFPAAKSHYDKTFKNILPADERNLQSAMKEGSVKHEVLSLSDKYFAKFKDIKDARIEVYDKIKDPDVRSHLLSDLEYRYAQKDKDIEKTKNDLMVNAALQLGSAPGVPIESALDPVTLSNLEPEERKTCVLAANPPSAPNDKIWAEFYGNKNNLSRMSDSDFQYFRARMNPAQRVEAEAMWGNARAGATASPDPKIAMDSMLREKALKIAIDTKLEGFDDTTTYASLAKKDKEAKALGDLTRQADEEKRGIEASTGKAMSAKEIEDLLLNIRMRKPVYIKKWVGSVPVPAYTVKDYSKIALGEIDKDVISKIKNRLQSTGQVQSDDNVKQLYLKMIQNKNLMNDITR